MGIDMGKKEKVGIISIDAISIPTANKMRQVADEICLNIISVIGE